MKVKTIIEIDMETGDYDIQFGISEGDKKKKIDQKEMTKLLRKVIDAWNLKFVN